MLRNGISLLPARSRGLSPREKLAQYLHVYVAPTASCGLGLFTARPLRTGDVALAIDDPAYFVNAAPRAHLLANGFGHEDIFQVGPDLFIPPYGAQDDFTNHSCDPNCGLSVGVSGFRMTALRPIAAHEELTYDYSTHQEHPLEDMECRCGAASCRGVVRSFSTLPTELQARYLELGHVGMFVHNVPAAIPTSLIRVG